MSADAPPAVPMTVISGFLGAGKTTYLNRLIHDGLERGALVLVNDFGDINIDRELIDYQDDRLISLTNGCVCCTLGGTLSEQLAEALRFTPKPSAVYIEASGVANPARIADIAKVSRKLYLKEVICLVDVSQALDNSAHPLTGDAWRQQVEAASRLVLNRLGDDSDHQSQVMGQLNELNATAARETLPAPPGVAWLEPERRTVTRPAAKASTDTASHPSALPWESITVDLPHAVEALDVEALLYDHADVLVRAKGFVQRRDREAPQVLQFSGQRISWQPALRVPTAFQLVCIGIAGERLNDLCERLDNL